MNPSESPSVVRLFSDHIDETVDDLGTQIVGLAGRLASATCRWLLLVARFDGRNGAAQFGLHSTARWLSHYCGVSGRTAVDHVRVARALATFESLREAMSAGRLSYSHVRAISRAVKPGDEDLVADLICSAEYGSVGQLETLVRGYRTAKKPEPGDADPQYVKHRWADDSRWHLTGHLDAENGAVVQSAVESLMRLEKLTAPQALVRMAEIALAAADSGKSLNGLRPDEKTAIVVHLDASELNAEHGRPAGRIDEGPGLPESVLRRLTCSGKLRAIVRDDGGSVLDVGRAQRLVTKRQYLALLIRKRTCSFPGCEHTKDLEAHHIQHWLDGGRTDLRNLTLLCKGHHHAHHEGEFSMSRDRAGQLHFSRADGAPLSVQLNRSAQVDAQRPVEEEHTEVAPDAAITRWDGTRLDRQYAISCLAS